MQKVAIFSNPIAGRGKARALALRLQERFQRQGWQSDLIFDRPDKVDPARLAELTAAVSIGGDGTLRAVVEQVTRGGREGGPGVVVVPMGTANLMGRHLGVAWRARDLEEHALEAIEHRKTALLDLAQFVHSPDGNPEHSARRLFLLMVGVGLDGQIVHALDRVRRGPIGFASYLLPSFATLWKYQFPAIEVEVDGHVVWPMRPGIAFVGNIAEYGWGMPLLPLARSDDGVLDVLVMPVASRTDLLRHTMSAVAGEHVHGEGVVYIKGRTVKIRSEQPVAAQADGDPAGFTPLEMQLLPTRVAFIVPP